MESRFGKLAEISVHGYKSIRALEALRLDDMNILIGANGAGKSNFISIFELLGNIAVEKLQDFVTSHGTAARLLHFGPKVTKEFRINLRTDANTYAATLVPTAEGGLAFEDESVSFKGTSKYIATGQQFETNLRRTRRAGAIPPFIYGALEKWRVYHFHDTSAWAPLRRTASLTNLDTLAADGGNLPAFLYYLQEKWPDSLEEIVATVRRIAPFFRGFVLRPDPLNEHQIRLRWRHAAVDDPLDVSDLSDGTLRFIALVTLLLQPEPVNTIVIDEPELGLHPAALGLLASVMHSVAHRVQLICSSQSVTFANHFSWKDMVIVDLVDDASTFRRLTEDDVRAWLDLYALGDIWEKNVIGGRP